MPSRQCNFLAQYSTRLWGVGNNYTFIAAMNTMASLCELQLFKISRN